QSPLRPKSSPRGLVNPRLLGELGVAGGPDSYFLGRAGRGPAAFVLEASALPAADIAWTASRFIVLMNSAPRKRTAVQSSSMATMRTGSKPAVPSAPQLLSRLSSDL